MVDRNTFTKMAKKVLRSTNGARNPQVIHPEREWLIGLAIATVGFSVSVAWAVHEYTLYRYITITDYAPAEQIVIYRENMVKDALGAFTQRAEEHQSLLSRVVELGDGEAVEVIEVTTDEVLDVVDSDGTTEERLVEEVEPTAQEDVLLSQ